MLPTGHIAGGYLITKAATKLLRYNFSKVELRRLYWLGMFMGFVPDLDMFYAFYKSGSLTINHLVADHRTYLPHTPVLWLILGLLIFTASKKPFTKAVGIVVWLGAWSHLMLDSFEHGVRWFWPITDKLYALQTVNHRIIDVDRSDFFAYWFNFLGWYATHSVTFYFEIIIIIAAIIIAIKSKDFIWQSNK